MDNLRRAIVIVSVIVMIGAGIIGFMFALDNISNSEENTVVELDPTGDPYDPDNSVPAVTTPPSVASDASTLLFVVTDNARKSPELIFTASADFIKHRICLVFYPVDMSVALKTSQEESEFKTLAEYYSTSSIEKLSEAVGGIMPLPIKGSFCFTFNTLKELINSFTSNSKDDLVSFYPPCTVNARSVDGSYVSVKKETNRFDGTSAVSLLGFYRTYDNVYDKELVKYYDGSRTPQLKVAAAFADAFVTQRLTGSLSSHYTANYLVFFQSFLFSCNLKNQGDFPSRIAEEYKKFTAANIDSYIVKTVKDPSGSAFIFSGSVAKVENSYGVIEETETLSGEALHQLAKSLY